MFHRYGEMTNSTEIMIRSESGVFQEMPEMRAVYDATSSI